MNAPSPDGTKPALVSGIIVLALFAYFGYHMAYVRPREAVAQVQHELTEAREQHELQTLVVTALQVLEAQRARFAERPDSDWLLQEVSRLTKSAGVDVQAVNPFAAQARGDMTVLRVSVEFSATYHELGRFLSRVESHPRFLQVDDVQLTSQGSSNNRANIRLTLSTVFMPPEMTVPVSPSAQAVVFAREEW